MAQTASPPALAPRLPEGQGKANLTDYAASAKAQATTKKYMQDLFPGQNKPLPALRDVDAQDRSASAKPSHSVQKRYALEERVLAPALENRPDPRSLECLIMLDQSSVGGTEKSSASTNPTTASSPLSRHHSNATQVPSTLTRSVKGSHRFKRTRRSLLQLPQGILGHILAYVFAEERAISITPYQSRVTPQRRRLRHGPNAVDIRSFMMHPALLVCHQMRNMGLHILYHDNLFLIDLCDANSASHTHDKDMGRHDMGKYWDCWTNATPPQMVQTALTHASNIRIELPVPGAETAMARGTTKRKKDSQEDKGVVLESLRRVTALIIGSSAASPPERPRAPSPPAPKALRRKLSFRSAKRHDSLEFVCRGDSPPLFVREPLSTLEVVLVKPAVAAEVHSQTLEMVTMCSSIPVVGNLEYHLELEGLRKLWAKRTMGQWLGSEPDGSKLLHDLRSLGHPRVKTECVQNSGRPREARAQPVARSDTTHRQRSRPTQPSSTTGSSSHRHVQVSLKEGSVAGKFREMEHLCKITFLKGNSKSPPTVGELQQIASDIRRGVY